MNEKIDPITGMPIDPNRAGMPGRSINDLQPINTIQDPGMQSAQQANAFQRFNNVAQYMPPPTMKKDEGVKIKGTILPELDVNYNPSGSGKSYNIDTGEERDSTKAESAQQRKENQSKGEGRVTTSYVNPKTGEREELGGIIKASF